MTRAPNRRAIIGVVLATGAVAAIPAAAIAATPTLSAVDRRVLDLWRRWHRTYAIIRRQSAYDADDDRRQRGYDAASAVERKIMDLMGESVLALACTLMVEIKDDPDDFGIYDAALAAIRPQLVSPIAEDADRVLAGAPAEEEA